jgi:hypothetical protein
MATKTNKTKPYKPKAEVRNLCVYKDDYDFFSQVADQNDRSRARMFRYAMAQIRDGRPIPYISGGGSNGRTA